MTRRLGVAPSGVAVVLAELPGPTFRAELTVTQCAPPGDAALGEQDAARLIVLAAALPGGLQSALRIIRSELVRAGITVPIARVIKLLEEITP